MEIKWFNIKHPVPLNNIYLDGSFANVSDGADATIVTEGSLEHGCNFLS